MYNVLFPDLKIKNSHETLQEDLEYIKNLKKNLVESKDDLVCFKSKYAFREKKLIAELAHIYPIEVVNFYSRPSIAKTLKINYEIHFTFRLKMINTPFVVYIYQIRKILWVLMKLR